jgi:hypothetical protein
LGKRWKENQFRVAKMKDDEVEILKRFLKTIKKIERRLK